MNGTPHEPGSGLYSAAVTYYQPPRKAGLWLGLSIAATLACCLPLGIPAIVYAAKAMGEESSGDYAEAERLTAKARSWTIAAVVASVLFLFVGFCFFRTSAPS